MMNLKKIFNRVRAEFLCKNPYFIRRNTDKYFCRRYIIVCNDSSTFFKGTINNNFRKKLDEAYRSWSESKFFRKIIYELEVCKIIKKGNSYTWQDVCKISVDMTKEVE